MTELIIIERDNVYRPLKFEGIKLAEVTDNFYSWTLYKTKQENFICVLGYKDYKWKEAVSAKSEKEVIDFFGSGDMALKLYEEAGFSKFELVR